MIIMRYADVSTVGSREITWDIPSIDTFPGDVRARIAHGSRVRVESSRYYNIYGIYR